MSDFRLLVQFRTFRVHNWVFDEIYKWFCMVFVGETQNTNFFPHPSWSNISGSGAPPASCHRTSGQPAVDVPSRLTHCNSASASTANPLQTVDKWAKCKQIHNSFAILKTKASPPKQPPPGGQCPGPPHAGPAMAIRLATRYLYKGPAWPVITNHRKYLKKHNMRKRREIDHQGPKGMKEEICAWPQFGLETVVALS